MTLWPSRYFRRRARIDYIRRIRSYIDYSVVTTFGPPFDRASRRRLAFYKMKKDALETALANGCDIDRRDPRIRRFLGQCR